MEYHEWKPAYQTILQAFGYSMRGDEASRDWLAAYCRRASCQASLPEMTGAKVAVVGGAPQTPTPTQLADADVVVAASDAGPRIADAGVSPDVVVTDLDGDPDGVRALATTGVPVVVHAHGDNQPVLEEQLPAFPASAVLPTTQAAPTGPVRNFGGFTDGDRAAFLADHCGADELVFRGWDLNDRTVSAEKASKLDWAARLLYWLEDRRGERFTLLDGRRDDLTVPWKATDNETR